MNNLAELLESGRRVVKSVVEGQQRLIQLNRQLFEQLGSAARNWTPPESPDDVWGPKAVESWFAFSAEVLEANRKFATAVADTWAASARGPQADPVAPETPKPMPAKSAPSTKPKAAEGKKTSAGAAPKAAATRQKTTTASKAKKADGAKRAAKTSKAAKPSPKAAKPSE